MSAAVDKTVLPNGITVLSQTLRDRRTLSLGAWLRTGSRDEPLERLGITHFIEHMMFKGTQSRDARAIAASLESLGGALDAFTTREQVCYTARVLSEHLPNAVDVISDLVCRSRFDDAEIEREKNVVREEILSYEDNPEAMVADQLSEQLWGADHALGRPILGTLETVQAYTRDAIVAEFTRRFRGSEIVVVAAGGLEHAALVDQVARGFNLPTGDAPARDAVPGVHRPSVRHEEHDLQQVYLSLGARGVASGDAVRYALRVAETLLGGGMSSRLFQRIREDAGLAYFVSTTLDFLRDGGAIGIDLGVSPDKTRQALGLLREELVTLLRDGPGADEVEAAKMQLKGSVVMGQESVSSRMYHIARQELQLGHNSPVERQLDKIMAVTHEQVVEVLRSHLAPERFSLAVRGPFEGGAVSESDWPVA
ncbi:MAG: insulinase family protein, partial [Candidatus Eisenbacteria bacterium]|nr:insulinase family protein [Candidatus Eisenbacteria bacterium]